MNEYELLDQNRTHGPLTWRSYLRSAALRHAVTGGGLASGLSQWGTSTGREMPRSYSGREKRGPSDYGVGGALGELAAEDQQLGFGRVEDTICISLYQ